MENRAHLPLWFKQHVAEKEKLGHKKAGKEAWEVIRRYFGDCRAETALRNERESLLVTLELPFATAERRIAWDRIEAFRERFRLGLNVDFPERDGATQCLLFFFPEANTG